MKSLDYYGLSLMFVTVLTGVNCQELTAVNTEESSLEDSTLTLSYKYSKKPDLNDNFFWYRQYPGEPPEFLIFHNGNQKKTQSRLSVKVSEDKTQVDLQISSAALTDSALYYCAVNDYGGNKIIFGPGTKLHIESRNNYKPSFYKLKNNDTNVCLATGFSKYGELKNNTLFEGTLPGLNSEDSLFNQVSFITSGKESECKEDDEIVPCDDTLKPDPTVNLMSVTVMGLRILLLKTIVFNVVMSVRLWTSQ